MPGLFRKPVDLDNYELPYVEPPKLDDFMSSLSESESDHDPDESDSVILNMKDRRRASGQDAADRKLRTKMYGIEAVREARIEAVKKTPFLDQFPYKSCQRGFSGEIELHIASIL